MDADAVIHRIRRTAERQHGRITWEQLVVAGADEHRVRRWTQKGWLVREHHRVYVVGARPSSRMGTFASALLTMGDDAALSFRAAGAHWELLRGAVPTEVTVPRRSGRGHRRRIIVHRADLPAEHVTVRDGLRVTTLVRTHLDLAGVLRPPALARMFEQAQVRHHLDPADLAAEVVCRRGCRGAPALRAILEDAVDPAAVASILELRFLKLCAAHGIARPVVNQSLGPWVPDFLWPDAWVIVETDGWRYHRTAERRRRDADKDAWLRARGYVVLRLTWQDVTSRPEAAAARVASALAAQADG
ncbi:DUF559 domain-containing protein [Paraconexibacter antarcticus]|uniref:DUF559 domain-containing protein n=1 Tax=Paraconexibacter antarcticus TaxID=2949664 RepID=A0ABY5DY78_9ACTN|nr:DUF559 domain-containing protein [Paraconexibacter antarcticus]UTI65514.1 DUF559 domain-containing protein [Paraconexibacter antarcticus]